MPWKFTQSRPKINSWITSLFNSLMCSMAPHNWKIISYQSSLEHTSKENVDSIGVIAPLAICTNSKYQENQQRSNKSQEEDQFRVELEQLTCLEEKDTHNFYYSQGQRKLSEIVKAPSQSGLMHQIWWLSHPASSILQPALKQQNNFYYISLLIYRLLGVPKH